MITRLFDPFESLLDFQRQLDDVMDSPWLGETPGGRGRYPPVNVFQRDDDFVVIAELPGVRKQDIELAVHRNRLHLSGTKAPLYGEDVSVHRKERASGAFGRDIGLPVAVDPDGVRAEFRDGLLAILIPRAPEERSRRISID